MGDELERGGGQSLWGDGQSQGQGECTTNSGERETQVLTKYRGINSSHWNDGGEAGSFRISRPEEVIQRTGHFRAG